MTANKKKILEMLAQNKISADIAYQLLNAIDDEGGDKAEPRDPGHSNFGHTDSGSGQAGKLKPKYLRVTVTPKDGAEPDHADRVNIRVPMTLVRAGLKMTALIPPEAMHKANDALHEKGINFDVNNLKPEDLEELIEALGDMTVDVESGHGEKVKVFVEY
jgi:hypothetical protein